MQNMTNLCNEDKFQNVLQINRFRLFSEYFTEFFDILQFLLITQPTTNVFTLHQSVSRNKLSIPKISLHCTVNVLIDIKKLNSTIPEFMC